MDNKEKTGKADRSRINLHEKYEVADWSKKFGVNEEQLRKAVEEVGSMAADVEEFLKSGRAKSGK